MTKKDRAAAGVESPTKSNKPSMLAALKKLKNPDLKFMEAEQYTDMYGDHMASLEKDHRKLTKKLSGTTLTGID